VSGYIVKGWHVLALVLGFFGVTIAVNVAFVTLAIGTFSGTVSEEPYVQGLHFNEQLAARATQAERGWTAAFDVIRNADETTQIVLVVRDAGGSPVRGLAVEGVIGRPATQADDRALDFVGAGEVYVATVDDLGDGAWRLSARTTFLDGAPFEASTRLWLP
jgi:nitrogen fixation protein FixH